MGIFHQKEFHQYTHHIDGLLILIDQFIEVIGLADDLVSLNGTILWINISEIIIHNLNLFASFIPSLKLSLCKLKSTSLTSNSAIINLFTFMHNFMFSSPLAKSSHACHTVYFLVSNCLFMRSFSHFLEKKN